MRLVIASFLALRRSVIALNYGCSFVVGAVCPGLVFGVDYWGGVFLVFGGVRWFFVWFYFAGQGSIGVGIA